MTKKIFHLIFICTTSLFSQPLNNWLEFDGVNDYVDLGNSSDLKPTDALTFEVWAYNSDWENASKSLIICNTEQGGYNLKISGGNISAIVRLNEAYSYTSYSLTNLTNNWHHFAATCDGQYVKLYVDGQLVDTEDAGSVYSIEYDSNNSTLLGAEVNGASTAVGDYFEGAIDEVRIWNVARTQSEIEDNMEFHLVDNEAGLVGYWRLDETSGSSAPDKTINNNDGTLYNMSESDWIELFTSITFETQFCYRSSIDWGDYNNDDYIDFITTGVDGENDPITLLYKNNGDGSFSKQSISPIYEVKDGNAEWGDYNNDGYLDILLTGRDIYSLLTRIYKNDQNGGFILEDNISYSGKGIKEGSAIWGDYNNDGYLDYLLYGNRSKDENLWKIRLFKNNGNGTFDEIENLPFAVLKSGCAAWGDYNNDGYIDLYISGYINGTYSYIYRNNGNGTFTHTISLVGVYNSTAKWGDINNDGYLDLVLTGHDDNNIERAILYKNNGDNSFSIISEFEGLYGASIDMGDYDNDGDLDLIFSGNDSNDKNFTALYKNNGDETFTQQTSINLKIVGDGTSSFCDIDNDGDLDILQNGTLDGGNATHFWLFENKTSVSNSSPSPPSNLSSSVDGSNVTFSWDSPTDDKTPSSGLKYKICIGSSAGKDDLLAPMSNTSNGFNRVTSTGDILSTTSVTINDLPENSDIYWSVQTIDAGMKGSQFASEQISSVLPVELTFFKAQLGENNVILNWQTATEVNNYGFEVERIVGQALSLSLDWQTIGFIPGHGNSSSPKTYKFIDNLSDLTGSISLDSLTYRLKQIDTDGSYAYYSTIAEVNNSVTGVESEEELPAEFSLAQNYPNPFNPSTTINYSIPCTVISNEVRNLNGFSSQSSRNNRVNVSLKIYNILGREVATLVNQKQSPGRYKIEFNAAELPSGVYIYRIVTDEFTASKKLILLK